MSRLFNYRDWPIATKLIVTLVSLITLSIVVAAAVGSFVAQQALIEELSNDLGLLAETEGQLIGELLEAQVNFNTGVATADTDLIEQVAAQNAAYEGTEAEILAGIQQNDEAWQAGSAGALVDSVLNNDAADSLRRLVVVDDQYSEFIVADRFGATVAASGPPSDYYQGDEEWWQQGWNSGQGGIFITDVLFDESADEFGVDVVVPVFDLDGEQVIGVMKATYSLATLTAQIAEFEIGETSSVLLLDDDGSIIADADLEVLPELDLAADDSLLLGGRIFQGSDVDFDTTNAEGVRTVTAWAPVETPGTVEQVNELGWVITIQQDRTEVFAPIRQLNTTIFVVAAITLVVSVTLGVLLARALTRQVEEIDEVFQAVGRGDFDARAEVLSNDELGRTADGVNRMLEQLTRLLRDSNETREQLEQAIRRIVTDVTGLAAGNLAVEVRTEDEITRDIALALNFAIGELNKLVANIETAATDMTHTSDSMTEIVDLIVQQSGSSAEMAQEAAASASDGNRIVTETVAAMERIRDNTQETARRIKRLGEVSQEISEAVRLIEEIADRTTVLALNASIQAAAAGDAGRGFAVVADEVQRLAERASAATRDIENMVKNIQTETGEAVYAIEEATREVVEGSQLAQRAGDRMSELNTLIERFSVLMEHVSTTTSEQIDDTLISLRAVSTDLNQSVARLRVGDTAQATGD